MATKPLPPPHTEPKPIEPPLQPRRDRLTPERERKLLDLHLQHCPHCAYELALVEAEGISVEMCEDCEGVWLTRAALNSLVAFPPEKRKAFVGGLFGQPLAPGADAAGAAPK